MCSAEWPSFRLDAALSTFGVYFGVASFEPTLVVDAFTDNRLSVGQADTLAAS